MFKEENSQIWTNIETFAISASFAEEPLTGVDYTGVDTHMQTLQNIDNILITVCAYVDYTQVHL